MLEQNSKSRNTPYSKSKLDLNSKKMSVFISFFLHLSQTSGTQVKVFSD